AQGVHADADAALLHAGCGGFLSRPTVSGGLRAGRAVHGRHPPVGVRRDHRGTAPRQIVSRRRDGRRCAQLLSSACRLARRRRGQPRAARILGAMDRVRPREALLLPSTVLEEVHRYAFVAMASRHELHVWAPDRAHADRAARAAIADVLRIEGKFTRYRDASVTSTINRNAGGGAVAIDAETVALPRYADRCHALSEGRFDLTSGVLR